ncbi:uncharacterized protein YqkB [Paenibacillus shirakamiensis]|uniref:Uncharacterized protein YqkB n=1 Tax=Paenibacillus shirakamiensis TaxID=1265935 RepID=A0ABS4JD89_9BACL|nr:iron-sulfur cluster biosynthesis family protein [Paenibacillus shirakamiensis]MBP1999673.1 uncharacterized protein YqkB [Paenibacillus shirakamiensis]
MNVVLDDHAVRIFTAKIGDSPGQIRLLYDTEGCGCDGITSFQIVSQPQPHDQPIQNDIFSFWVDGQRAIYYEENLRIKGDPLDSSFRLEGDSQVYSRNVKIVDAR